LGHGAFGLKHSFDPEYGISDNPQITKALNLMGYTTSTTWPNSSGTSSTNTPAKRSLKAARR
jgi:hypothetical protein